MICKHEHSVTIAGENVPAMCGSPAVVTETVDWVNPLCREHYDYWLRRPPKTELRFADGHRELRNNFVYGEIYKDVETEFDGERGVVIPGKVTYFEREDMYRDKSGKVMLLFYREIPDPTPKQVRAVNALIKTGTNKPAGRIAKIINRIKLWFAMRGVG